MDKFNFMSCVSDQFEGLQYEETIETRANEMIQIILQQKELTKAYLKAGIYKLSDCL